MTERDSAGIRIVEAAARSLGDGEMWTVAPQPAIEIGVVDGGAAYQFGSIRRGALHPDGSVALMDRGSGEVRVRIFDPNGVHRVSLGGSGTGPGEFRGNLAHGLGVTFIPPDTVLVAESGRLMWYHLDGRYERGVDLHASMGLLPMSGWHVLPDGSALLERTELRENNRRTISLVPGGTQQLSPIADLPGSPMVLAGRLGAMHPFGPIGAVGARAEPLSAFVADPWRWEVRVHGEDGTLRQILRPAARRTPLTRDLVQEGRQRLDSVFRENDNYTPAVRSELLRGYDAFQMPDSLPAIDQVVWDDEGYLWLSHNISYFHRGSLPRVFEVLTYDGTWVGRVSMPRDMGEILHISHGRILVRHIDDLGVNYARVYLIERPVP